MKALRTRGDGLLGCPRPAELPPGSNPAPQPGRDRRANEARLADIDALSTKRYYIAPLFHVLRSNTSIAAVDGTWLPRFDWMPG